MHVPVLTKEVLEYLRPQPNENFIDATIGEAGHTWEILKRNGPQGRVLGIDRDPQQIENCPLKINNLGKRVTLVCASFADLEKIVRAQKFGKAQGVLLDLGMSSWHLQGSGRGFSFKRQEPLDMRYNTENNLTAEKIVNYWSKPEIEKIIKEYGEEKKARQLAELIIKTRGVRAITKTEQLVKIINKVGVSPQRTFQALRIAVNDELEHLEQALIQALEVMSKGGRLVIISFHSLEDRLVKNFFKENADRARLEILTKKPIMAQSQEIKINPRARSAKLRAAIKL